MLLVCKFISLKWTLPKLLVTHKLRLSFKTFSIRPEQKPLTLLIASNGSKFSPNFFRLDNEESFRCYKTNDLRNESTIPLHYPYTAVNRGVNFRIELFSRIGIVHSSSFNLPNSTKWIFPTSTSTHGSVFIFFSHTQWPFETNHFEGDSVTAVTVVSGPVGSDEYSHCLISYHTASRHRFWCWGKEKLPTVRIRSCGV